MKYDFEGWVTKYNQPCDDGRTIRSGAFHHQSNMRVPLVYAHCHKDPDAILGFVDLETRDEGVYGRGSFNSNPKSQRMKTSMQHGDIESLSICANNLDEAYGNVNSGVIREVSLVIAGANPGAFIESVVQHGMPADPEDDEAIFYNTEKIIVTMEHAANMDDPKKPEEKKPESKEEPKKDDPEGDDETIQDVFNTMSKKQQDAVAALIGMALADAESSDSNEEDSKEKKDDKKEDDTMKHNAFMGGESDDKPSVLTHEATMQIFTDAKNCGSLREAIHRNIEEGNIIMHSMSVPMDGMTGPSSSTSSQGYGIRDMEMLFPEFKSLNTPPEFIGRNMNWVTEVMSDVHHTPFSRIKSIYANITEDEARAKGYIKGHQKKEEVFTLLKRTTEAQMIYKLQKVDRQDIIQITDFDVVAWIRSEMRMMLDEEIARAILIGDGRLADSEFKIHEDNVRPVVSDKPLYNTVIKVKPVAGESFAETLIDAVIKARKNYKGSGSPKFWTTEDYLTDMLLIKDKNGRRIYSSEQELATTMRASKITTVEPMEDKKVTVNGTEYPLIGTLVNLNDYNVGTDKGGEITNFDDFDINYNQYTYLIETMMSGALIKPFSAVTFVLDNGTTSGTGDDTKG